MEYTPNSGLITHIISSYILGMKADGHIPSERKFEAILCEIEMCKNYHLSIIFLGKPWVFHSYASLSQGNIEIIESFTKLKQQ
jgi:hypothetical protein